MNIARIRDGVVVNIEVGDEQWLTDGAGGDHLVPYTDDAPARIGYTWDGEAFAPPVLPQPAPEPDSPGLYISGTE